MCTLALLHQVVPDAPLVALANRDEFLSRPTSSPALHGRSPWVYCGLDELQGGTWCGLNGCGLFVGLTNLSLGEPDPGRRSRGLLCLDLLALECPEQVSSYLQTLPRAQYNPFRLIATDGKRALQVRYEQTVQQQWLEPGIHVITNWPEQSPADRKRRNIELRLKELVRRHERLPLLVPALTAFAAEHHGIRSPRSSICCHAPGYGTRCSTLLAVGPAANPVLYLHADGAPCRSSFYDHSEPLRTLLAHKGPAHPLQNAGLCTD